MIQKSTIDNTNIYFQANSDLPMLDIALNFRAGSAFDGNFSGLANLAASLFATKTTISSEQELINKITDIGASIHAETTKEYFSIKIRALSDDSILTALLSIIKEIFTLAVFDEKILAREKSQLTTYINYLYNQPNYLASLELSKQLFDNNPYSQPTIGHINTIKNISSEDIASFYKQLICANNANICIIGDINDNKAKDIANTLVRALPKGTANLQTFKQTKNTTNLIKIPHESKQTSILIGHQLFLDIESPWYFPLKLGNEIFGGGGLNSLLFSKVREELGLVYNIGSSINLNPEYGSFIVSAQTSNPKLTLATINDIYKDFINTEINDETLVNTKKHIEGTHLLGSVKNSSKLNMMSSMANKKLPLDFFDTYTENINKVTAKQIKDAFDAIQYNKFITVQVGAI